MSEYLTAVKPDMQKLVELLKKDFAYVSVLCTDVTGTTYLVDSADQRWRLSLQ